MSVFPVHMFCFDVFNVIILDLLYSLQKCGVGVWRGLVPLSHF